MTNSPAFCTSAFGLTDADRRTVIDVQKTVRRVICVNSHLLEKRDRTCVEEIEGSHSCPWGRNPS